MKIGIWALAILTALSLDAIAFAPMATGAQQAPEHDVFAFLRALDDAGARNVWPGFDPSQWPIALFDGQQTVLLRHPSPPVEFAPMPGRPGVLAMSGQHPAVVWNSTKDIGGVRTATVIATPEQEIESTMLASIEEVFHVFWLNRHTNFRPNEMARYAYPVKDSLNLRDILAEDEALARALDAENPQEAAGWAAEVIRIRRERLPRMSDDGRAFETGLEMMEGTANYAARVAVGQNGKATAERLRVERQPDQIRWRFYDTGAAICFLLDRFQPDWKALIDGDLERTVADLLEAAIARAGAQPAEFSEAEAARFESRAAGGIAALSERQRAIREDLLGRGGPRIVIEVAGDAEPLRVARFDPMNLFVLDGGEAVHPHHITLTCPSGTIELANPGFARGSFAGTVALTRAAGRHPIGDGVRALTIVGVRGAPRIDRSEGRLTLEAEGVRIALQGADVRTEGDTLRMGIFATGVESGSLPPGESTLDKEYQLAGERSQETQYFLMESRLITYALDGKRIGTDIFRLRLKCVPAGIGGRKGDEYTCARFTLQQGDAPETEIPALENWTYVLNKAGMDEKGQVFGIDHARFENLANSAGAVLSPDKAYHVYNAFIDFHSFGDVFAESAGEGKGIQDLKRIGQKIVHAASFSEPPVNLGSNTAEGSYFRNGEITLEFKGLGVVNGRMCALLGYDSGESSFKMIMRPMPNMEIQAVGSSHYRGDIYKDLATNWVQKATMIETVVSETALPMPPNKINSVIERIILIRNVDEKEFNSR